VRIHKFSSTEAFIAIDLEGAGMSSGPVRWAGKVLQGGAKDLARSQTYTYAVLGMARGGASAGISADGPDRSVAIEAFVAEAGELVASGMYLPDAAKGVAHDDLASLTADDPRDTARMGAFANRCEGLGVAVVAEKTLGSLDGRSVAIEGFGAAGPSLATALAERGANITAISTASGMVRSAAGFPAPVLASSWRTHGADLVSDLGAVEHASAIFGLGVDILFTGSKVGIVDHLIAAQLTDVTAVVPCGRLPLTARALAVLRSAGVAVPADFVALAGPTLALWGDANRTDDQILAGIAEHLGDLSVGYASHEDGPLLAACYDAERFLSIWQESLPFGRPLAP
jgi:glutamate dehydrogenase/leucine dehydrogenase